MSVTQGRLSYWVTDGKFVINGKQKRLTFTNLYGRGEKVGLLGKVRLDWVDGILAKGESLRNCKVTEQECNLAGFSFISFPFFTFSLLNCFLSYCSVSEKSRPRHGFHFHSGSFWDRVQDMAVLFEIKCVFLAVFRKFEDNFLLNCE